MKIPYKGNTAKYVVKMVKDWKEPDSNTCSINAIGCCISSMSNMATIYDKWSELLDKKLDQVRNYLYKIAKEILPAVVKKRIVQLKWANEVFGHLDADMKYWDAEITRMKKLVKEAEGTKRRLENIRTDFVCQVRSDLGWIYKDSIHFTPVIGTTQFTSSVTVPTEVKEALEKEIFRMKFKDEAKDPYGEVQAFIDDDIGAFIVKKWGNILEEEKK